MANFLIATGLGSIFIMTLLGWYNRELPNADRIAKSDTFLVYDDSSRIRAKGIMKNKLKEGHWQEYNERGSVVSDLDYKHGLVEGHVIIYYDNGKKQMEGDFLHDKRNGTFTIWYPNGNMQNQGTFKEDKKVGIWKTWFENGNPAADTNCDSIQ